MGNSNEMFKITNSKKVILNKNTTSGGKILNADNVDVIEAEGNKAENINHPNKNNHLTIKKAFFIILTGIILPLLVAYLAYVFKWS
ncbi:hypothetical protein AB3N49_12475 [Enterobacter cloacae]|uniref:hypothetical protein n=1 Tax=Enterobacter cloacae TaxID=550 RepID=UPI0034A363B2